MMSVGDIMSILGDVQYTGGYHEYTWGFTMMSVGDIMSTLGGVQYTRGYHNYTRGVIMSTLGDTKMHVGVIMRTPGVFSTPEGYHEYTRGFWYEWEKTATEFPGFLFKHLLRLCSCICWPLEHQTAC